MLLTWTKVLVSMLTDATRDLKMSTDIGRIQTRTISLSHHSLQSMLGVTQTTTPLTSKYLL